MAKAWELLQFMRGDGIPTKSEHHVSRVNTGETLDLSRADWDDLRLFRVIAGQGSLRRAAKKEGVVVNTVRDRLERLEAAMARTLLRRTRRGVFLTEAGARLAEAIGEMNEAAYRARVAGSRDVLVRPGELTIACAEGLGTLWLMPRMGKLRRTVPDLTVGLICDYDLARDRASEADVWLTFEQPTQQDLIVSRLATLHFLPFASPAYVHRHGAPQTVDDLKAHKIVEHCAPGARSEMLDYLIGSDRPKGLLSVRTNSSLAQLWAVAEGEGIGGLPTYVHELTLAIIPVPPLLHIRRELRLVYHADARRSPAVRAAVDWLHYIFDGKKHPCFRDIFVHPDDFPVQPPAAGVALLMPGMLDQLASTHG